MVSLTATAVLMMTSCSHQLRLTPASYDKAAELARQHPDAAVAVTTVDHKEVQLRGSWLTSGTVLRAPDLVELELDNPGSGRIGWGSALIGVSGVLIPLALFVPFAMAPPEAAESGDYDGSSAGATAVGVILGLGAVGALVGGIVLIVRGASANSDAWAPDETPITITPTLGGAQLGISF
jgi:hypothetical protein